MQKNTVILKWSILAGSVYFLGIAIVHMLGYKIPGLYIYFDVPSYMYQDRITSFLAFGWAAFFFVTFTDPQRYINLVKAILIAGAVAIIGLSIINLTTNFADFSASIQTWMFWMETAGMFVYWIWLVIFYLRFKIEILLK
jgi:hypothetical protein